MMKRKNTSLKANTLKVTSLSVLALLMFSHKSRAIVTCGDGIVESPETCDDGNRLNYDGCSSSCVLETYAPEEGFTCNVVGTLTVCTEVCGKGRNFKKIAGLTKQCDDDNLTPGDGCAANCEQEAGWLCSGGSRSGPDTCVEVCGDGYNLHATQTGQPGGRCDDANKRNYDGCSSSCLIEDGWYCQLGGASDTAVATVCYEEMMDGKDFGTFECDTDGPLVDSDTNGCYEGLVKDGWSCSGGTVSTPDTCIEVCGDGYHFLAAPACDDGNIYDDDGCDSLCVLEEGFYESGTAANTAAQVFIETCDGYDYGYLDCDCGMDDCSGCVDCGVSLGYRCQPATTDPSAGSTCSEVCGDGYNYVPGGTVCDDGNLRNKDGCSSTCGIEFGFACDFTTTATADVCYEVCGDGYDIGKYACDDGNLAAYDGCSPTCTIYDGWYCYGGTTAGPDTCYETCGDGRNYHSLGVTSCDDGNTHSNDGCSSSCVVEAHYECTGGDYDMSDFCIEICGDGYHMTTGIECDDGNSYDNDGCDDACYVEEGFYCYGGSPTQADTCYEECGDGLRFTGSSILTFCDDGNTDYYDGCDGNCGVEIGFSCIGGSTSQPDTCYEICGDGKDYEFLECEDQNTASGDGCSATCEIEVGYDCYGGTGTNPDTCYEICGDGKNFGVLECDDGSFTSDYDGCKDDCTIQDGWYCALGSHSAPDQCFETCGDGYHYHYDQGELECDDGVNQSAGTYDGCSNDCLIEEGWYCVTVWADYDLPTECYEHCHDGMRFNTDATYCDTNGEKDGCDANCNVQDGWYCYGGNYNTADSCFEICGDGYDYDAFACDDGNTSANDGCSAACTVEVGWTCTQGAVRTGMGIDIAPYEATACVEICGDGYNHYEFECDDDNNAYYDGCSPTCGVEDGFYCHSGTRTTADSCFEICGDQYDFKLLPCDDGNADMYDGCYECQVEDGWYCVTPTSLVTGFPGYFRNHYENTVCYDDCGDGYLVDEETFTCDDGDSSSGDGCSAKCQIERGHYCTGGSRTSADTCYEVCGDGWNMPLTSGDCDDGNNVAGDGCTSSCAIEDGWYCYGGTSLLADECFEKCGDQYDFGTFACEDGNTANNDGCSSACAVEDGWYCYGGSGTTLDTCFDICDNTKFVTGNAATHCDDATNTLNDGCSNCMVQEGWYCYGGDATTPSTCKEKCGDSTGDFGTFACDDGNTYDNDGCSSACAIETGYECDGGSPTASDTCNEICGDNFDIGFYQCDDGNTHSGDGCSSTCEYESGYECSGGSMSGPDTCHAVCGDGLIRSTEVCDDDNEIDGDGCSSTCTVETGYECDGAEPTVCTEICGDGYNFGTNECDDGDVYDNDGCTSGCEIELGYECSGGDHTTADICTQTEFISGSLAECQAVAGTFLETCSENGGTTAPTFAAMATSSVTCEDNYGGLCIGTKDADDICTWERKLCVTCFKDAATGYVKIRVQTNSFPDHCYYASTNTPIENLIDFEAGFNLQSNLATLPEMAITTQTALDDLLCASAWPELTSQVANLAAFEYSTSSGDSMGLVVGVALNGVPILAGTSELGFDAFSPKTYQGLSAKSIAADLCLGNNDQAEFYHYYSSSPCILPGTYKSAVLGGLCSANTACKSSKATYMTAVRTSQKTLTVIGIAKSGHKIYGPYDATGTLWQPCDVDVCNGRMVDGEYAFVMTTFHPYTVGCFSTGTQPLLTASCSTNPRICAGDSAGSFLQFSYAVMMAVMVLFVLFQ